MKIFAISNLVYAIIAVAVIAMTFYWKFRKNSASRLPAFLNVGVALATVALAGLSFLSTRYQPPKSAAPSVAQTADSTPVGASGAQSLPVSFQSAYVTFKRPKPRIWIQTADHNWLETYDGQTSNIFTREATTQYDGCPAAVLRKRGEDSFEVLIPYPSCPQMLRFRWQKGPWQDLGPISNLSGTVPASDAQKNQ